MDQNFTAFGGFDLSTVSPYLEFDRRDANTTPKRTLDMEPMARSSVKKLLGASYSERIIPITGHVKAPSRDEADHVRDLLLMHLQATQANLDIVVSGALRSYSATYQNDVWTNIEGGLVTFTINFLAADPFGFDGSSVLIPFSNPQTAAINDTAVTWDGSWWAEPAIVVLLNSGTGLTSKTISVSNPDTGEIISITRTWTAGDTILVDTLARNVFVNSVIIDYVGVFPRWFPGAGTVRITDTLTTRSLTVSGSYVRKWL